MGRGKRSGRNHKISESGLSSLPIKKLCLTGSLLRAEYGRCHVIYVVDVPCSHSPDPLPLNPILELDIDDFCASRPVVLGTKLYVIGGERYEPDVEDPGFLRLRCTSEVFIFDIKDTILSSSTTATPTKLHKGCAYRRLDMHGIKTAPFVARIDEHRICVFSAHLGKSVTNFELLDARDECCKPLPDIMDFYPLSHRVNVSTFSSNRSTLMVSVDAGRVYRMDFDAGDPKWVRLPAYRIPGDLDSTLRIRLPVPCVVIRRSVICTPFELVDLRESAEERHCPLEYKDRAAEEDLVEESGGVCMEGGYGFVARCGESNESGERFLWVHALRFPDFLSAMKPEYLEFSCFSLDNSAFVDDCFPIQESPPVEDALPLTKTLVEDGLPLTKTLDEDSAQLSSV